MSAHKALLATTSLCTGLLIAALAAPAWAADQAGQTPPPATTTAPPKKPPPPPEATENTSTELVVTGSRIKTTTFTSAAPLTVITAQQAELEGTVDTAQVLQLSPAAASSTQVNAYYSGFLTAGGPGVDTLSLFNLGPQRTVFLINGERAGPAGVSGQVGPFDLNVIPLSMIDHIDVLKDGASSIYGSDAVAGVVNFVTKANQDGGDIRAVALPSEHGGGDSYQVSASYGKTWSKGYVTAGFDWYRQDQLTLGQRDYLNCSQELQTDTATGKIADIVDPATGNSKCFNVFTDTVEDVGLGAQVYRPNPVATAGGGIGNGFMGLPGWDQNGWQAVDSVVCGVTLVPCFIDPKDPNNPVNVAGTRNSVGLAPENDPRFEQNQAISPEDRYTFTLFGGYNLTPHAQLYGSVIVNDRESSQNAVAQFFLFPLNPANPFNTALGPNPIASALFGAPVNGFVAPVPVLEEFEPLTQSVLYQRYVGGVKGDLPNWGSLTNWTYDLYGQYAVDDGSYTTVYQKNDRVNATGGAGAGTNGCDVNSTFYGGESMAQAEPGVACVPVNYIAAAMNGFFQPQEEAFLFSKATGHTVYAHMYVDGSVTGDLFRLPAGPLSGAFGFEVRREYIKDTPAADFINQNVYNQSTVGITVGGENVYEAYGELKVPVVKGVPFFYDLNFDVSGRYSDYSSFGGNFTYKGTVDWRVTDWFELRGTYGTAFRAPALYELFLANQTGFLNQNQIDPCINLNANPGASATLIANCAASGIDILNYAGGGSSATILTGGGAALGLKPETSVSQTFGFVVTPSWGDRHLNVRADWFSFDVKNQIAQFGAANILQQCYASPNFPNSPFCKLFTRNPCPPIPQGQQPNGSDCLISTVNNDFINISRQLEQGIELEANYRTELPKDVKMTLDADLVWTLENNTFLFGGTTNNFLGSLGSPRFDGNASARFDWHDWTLNYYALLIGHSSDNPFISTVNPNFLQTGESVTRNYRDHFYALSSLILERRFDKFTATVGVRNLFDSKPPLTSTGDIIESGRVGNVTALISQYDLIGRAFYLAIEAKF